VKFQSTLLSSALGVVTARIGIRGRAGVFCSTLLLVFGCAQNGTASIILTNGSFESTGASYGSGLFDATGWTNNSALNIQASSAPGGFEATDAGGVTGSRYLRLASDAPDPQNTGFIVQNLGNMVAGETYMFTGDVLGGLDNDGLFGATVELTSDGSLNPTTVYDTQVLSGFGQGVVGVGSLNISYTATALDSGNPLFLWLRAAPSGNGQATRGGIDNIQLTTATPEPASIALFPAGLVALGLLRRRS
jgi:hypothetical protein